MSRVALLDLLPKRWERCTALLQLRTTPTQLETVREISRVLGVSPSQVVRTAVDYYHGALVEVGAVPEKKPKP